MLTTIAALDTFLQNSNANMLKTQKGIFTLGYKHMLPSIKVLLEIFVELTM